MSAFILSRMRMDLTRLNSKETSAPPQHVGVRRIRPTPQEWDALLCRLACGRPNHRGIAAAGLPVGAHRCIGSPPRVRDPGGRSTGGGDPDGEGPVGRDPGGRPESERRSWPAGGADERCSSTCWWPLSPRNSPLSLRTAERCLRSLRLWGFCWARWLSGRRASLPDQDSITCSF